MHNHLHLLPRPLHLATTSETVDAKSVSVTLALDSAAVSEAGPEAYRLILDRNGARITARTKIGLRWGQATLAQLRQQGQVPCLVIDDAPRFPIRGVCLDISRNRIPTMATLRNLVDHLAAWKMNHLQLYVEHALAYRGHEEVWHGISPISLEELTELDLYCRHRGVDLTANQNCLGHFERWLDAPSYAHLAELDIPYQPGYEWYYESNTLCPTDPGSQALVADLLAQQLPLCSGAYANVGGDEPWDFGKGRSRETCAIRGRDAVFEDYITGVAQVVRRLGKRPQYWADASNHTVGLPKDLVALVWHYEDSPQGFAPLIQCHVAAGREVWVAPGTSCWNSSCGRTWNRRRNLDLAVAERDAAGFLCTAWGDAGHGQQWPITLFGYADAAMAAWSGADHYDDHANGLHAFGSSEVGAWLAELGQMDGEICRGERPDFHGAPGQRLWNTSALGRELHLHPLVRNGPGDRAAWEEVRSRADAMAARLPPCEPLLGRELRHAVDIARWTCDRAILRRGTTDTPDAGELQHLARRMAELLHEYRLLWLSRCRYGGLKDSCIHYRRIIAACGPRIV
jgi:hypothetical protein